MVKSELRLEALKLRSKGSSIKYISRLLQVSTSSVSKWVKEILLTQEQIELLRQSELKGKALGRLKSTFLHKNERMKRVNKAREQGIQEISQLSQRELLLCGAALYWGEGNKKSRRTEFFNSDPKMIQFLLIWLQKCMEIKIGDIYCRVGINEIHNTREGEVKIYWSNITGIPLIQFKKQVLKKSRIKKFIKIMINIMEL